MRPTPLGAVGSLAYHALLRARPASFREHVCGKLRRLLVSLGDPAVTFDVAGSRLRMPLSHDLPWNVRRFPRYSENLARLARATLAKYPDLAVVDIGANIGDSLALVRRAGVADVLCVEGAEGYLPFLRANAEALGGRVTIAPVLVGARTGELAAALVTSNGTGRLTPAATDAGATIALRTLSMDDVLAAYPVQGRVNWSSPIPTGSRRRSSRGVSIRCSATARSCFSSTTRPCSPAPARRSRPPPTAVGGVRVRPRPAVRQPG